MKCTATPSMICASMHAAIAHIPQFGERQDRAAVAVAAALHPDQWHRRQARRRLGLVAAAREDETEIGADLGCRVDAQDRLVETEFAGRVAARDDDEIGVGLVALQAGVFDLGDELGERDRVHLIA